LPWSTSNEDLVELFQTIGSVERAEIQYEPNGRSRGSGVVQFSTLGDASTAIEKFQGYSYGGRPLGLDYAKYPDSGAMEGQEPGGVIQEQIM
jgi:RNA recognition motif-containing protein